MGQPAAVAELRAAARQPVHAYLLVGPRGSGKRALARAFAAALLSAGHTGADAVRHAELALAEAHPDLLVVERRGASISVEQADEIIAAASRSSVEGGAKVLVLDEFHLVTTAGPKLLKSIEEPPPGTVFVVLADEVPADLVTIASRCVRIELGPVPVEAIVERLEAEGVPAARAADAAAVAGGDLARARLLATDERLALRRQAWHDVPDRLDGAGGSAVEVADEVLAMITDAMASLTEAQAAEAAELEERVQARGERGSGRALLEARHKREARRYRADEVRSGLTELSRRYRDELAASVELHRWHGGHRRHRRAGPGDGAQPQRAPPTRRPVPPPRPSPPLTAPVHRPPPAARRPPPAARRPPPVHKTPAFRPTNARSGGGFVSHTTRILLQNWAGGRARAWGRAGPGAIGARAAASGVDDAEEGEAVVALGADRLHGGGVDPRVASGQLEEAAGADGVGV